MNNLFLKIMHNALLQQNPGLRFDCSKSKKCLKCSKKKKRVHWGRFKVHYVQIYIVVYGIENVFEGQMSTCFETNTYRIQPKETKEILKESPTFI